MGLRMTELRLDSPPAISNNGPIFSGQRPSFKNGRHDRAADERSIVNSAIPASVTFSPVRV